MADDMILCIEDPKDSIRKLLELMNFMNLAKLQDTKSIQRNHLHFYILTMKNLKENSGINPLHHCDKKNQYCENDCTTKHNL